MKKITLVFLLILATVLTSFAHEFWLALEKFILKVGEKAKISFLVGEDFTGEIWKGSASSFYLFNSEGKKDIISLFPTTLEEGTSLTFTKEGTHLLAFNSQNKFIELEPDKFLAYLEEDGLEEVITLRKQRNETEKNGRETYQRCAKALVQVGEKTDNTFATNTGLTLEIIPEKNPYKLKSNESLKVKIIFQNKPLSNSLVKIWHRKDGKVSKIEQKTDAKGFVSFQMEKQGEWMVSIVKMIPHPNPAQADWQSYWASLTFGF
ncbi:DUF4198 domain-containing protein [Thermoflexibacter ruber]|uniref:Uncharacterized conserved protein, contains GH25 family domain n=1 Tax=Thermoflexibacter ruber TaxID=1003 RepID=A0A1I2C2M3_9BACT|nr:DUF4198 domain-containing protein [Thermoflexibacter ruber]SFE62577.1 Uncharacterized conserved protein, contains GH25 family domain [Thermoflexibacter ruber]